MQKRSRKAAVGSWQASPPGYQDKGKGDDLAAGDYFVWTQLLEEATRRHSDVLLITGDVKEDWWRRERGQTRGPRLELVDELRNRCGGRLFMLRPESLLQHAKDVLDVAVSDASVQDGAGMKQPVLMAVGWYSSIPRGTRVV